VFSAGFRTAMWITAGIAAGGGLLAWATIRNPPAPRPPGLPEPRGHHCALDGPPLTCSAGSAAGTGRGGRPAE